MSGDEGTELKVALDPIEALRRALGHASPATTYAYYMHTLEAAKRLAHEAIERFSRELVDLNAMVDAL